MLDVTVERVRSGVAVTPTSRIKNTGTILEKLDRYGGSWLKSLHDLAGMRIVGDFDRLGKDDLVAALVELFADGEREPRVIDRRRAPVQGYRAVHVIVFPEGFPVEIQVRTQLQHAWAEMFEKIADRIGRGIRYGEQPRSRLSPAQIDELGERGRELSVRADAARTALVLTAFAAAEAIAAVEQVEMGDPDRATLPESRQRLEDVLRTLQRALLDI